ncbi:hypothetical protein DL769_002844 [Monosporascus sp. CRB-8-3]|nr:hypothetical protein DL769_002844 [Monosporascus sp. CRB-8-3]
MDHTRGHSAPNMRPFTSSTKHRGLALFALAAAGLAAAGVQYGRSAMRRNELAQRSGAGSDAPNLYVSVDRSGGGI